MHEVTVTYLVEPEYEEIMRYLSLRTLSNIRRCTVSKHTKR